MTEILTNTLVPDNGKQVILLNQITVRQIAVKGRNYI